MRISVRESRDLQATIKALAGLDRAIKAAIRAHTKRIALPEWQAALRGQAETRLDHRVLVDSATVKISDQNITLSSASKGKLSSGARAPQLGAAVEFGAIARDAYSPARSVKGKQYKRRTRRQLPDRADSGRVVYPAAKRIIPRIASLWTQTVVRTVHEILEEK